MLAKLVKENQKDWDLHIPKVLFAYRTALHESSGYSPYRVNFGRSPNLPVDVMLGRVPLPGEGEEKEIPEFVEDVNHSLKGLYDDVRRKLKEVKQKSKSKYDEKVTGRNLTVGDRVWLYVPAVKQGRTRKLPSLWSGPYTVINRVGAVIYWIQLIGSPKRLVVHRNRLKFCYGEPQVKASNKQPTPAPRNRGSEAAYPSPTSPPATPASKPTYAEVIANQQETRSSGGYTISSDELPIGTGRPQRNHRPPVRYEDYITHYIYILVHFLH